MDDSFVSSIQNTLLEILSDSLHQKKFSDSRKVAWEELMAEAVKQTVFPLVFAACKNTLAAQIDAKEYQKYYQRYLEYTAGSVQNKHNHKEIAECLNGIPYVIIKGQASAAYYPSSILRTAGDVDILVNQENMEQAGERLEKLGYRKTTDTEHPAHIAYYRNKEAAELHWQPSGIPIGEKNGICKHYLSNVVEDAKEYDGMRVPGDFHHCVIMLLHIVSHLTGEGIGLRHLCDWAVYVENEDVSCYKGALEEMGIWRFAQILTQVSVRYLGVPDQPWARIEIEDNYLKAFMADIFASGNFGCKDPHRMNDWKFMALSNDNAGMIRQLMRSLAQKSRLIFPITKEKPLLLPFGCMIVGFRHLIRIIQGKRPSIHVHKLVDSVQQRQSIYSEFRLFQ